MIPGQASRGSTQEKSGSDKIQALAYSTHKYLTDPDLRGYFIQTVLEEELPEIRSRTYRGSQKGRLQNLATDCIGSMFSQRAKMNEKDS